jgi:DNA ligase (NAD+)
MLTFAEYKKLVQKVNQYRTQAHLFDVEEISEEALDNLKMQITQFETQNPDKIDTNSPNFTIAGGVAQGFTKYTHSSRMLSLNDIFDQKELDDWQERWQNYATKESIDFETAPKYICEPKIDGLAMSLYYENGQLKVGATRGDGFVGEDVTTNILQIKSIPKNIEDNRKLRIRGEIFMTKSDFEDLNKQIIDGNKVGKMGKTGQEGVFANPRNVASGTIRQLDSRIVAERNLSFIAYNVDLVE